MKNITLYYSYRCHDRDITDKVFFTNENDAKTLSERNAPYSGVSKETFKVYDSIEDHDKNSVSARRKSALAKLTEEEKEALGLLEGE